MTEVELLEYHWSFYKKDEIDTGIVSNWSNSKDRAAEKSPISVQNRIVFEIKKDWLYSRSGAAWTSSIFEQKRWNRRCNWG